MSKIIKKTNITYSKSIHSSDEYGTAYTYGDRSIASTDGVVGESINIGHHSASVATGTCGIAQASGYKSVAVTTELEGASFAKGIGSIAISTGNRGIAKAGMGSAFCLVVRNQGLKIEKVVVGIPGKDGIEADTWYWLEGERLVKLDL